MNQTQSVRNAVNIFIIVAIGVSLVQELTNISHKPTVPPVPTPDGQPVPTQLTGPKLQGIRIQSSDNFQAPLKQLLAKKELNVDIVPYEFQGNDYWMSMLANWGHMAIIFYFMTKHKNETDAGKKKQIMIMGAIAVVGWFYFSPKLKPQRFAIQVKGQKVYERDFLIEQQVSDALDEYEFDIDEINEKVSATPTGRREDTWEEREQPNPSGNQQNAIPNEELNDDQIEF